MRFASGNQAAVRSRPAVEAALLAALQRADPDQTWGDRHGNGYGIGLARQQCRHDPRDVSYTWLVRAVRHDLGSEGDARVAMAALRVARRLQAQGVVRLTWYRTGQIGAVRLLADSPTDGAEGRRDAS